MSGNELPKVIDKTQADIDAAIDAIKSCDLPCGTKDFAISCIKLAVWLPKALLEQKIRLSNLRKLIFGRGKNKRAKPNKGGDKPSAEKPEPGPPANDKETSPSGPPVDGPSAPANCAKLPGHGHLPTFELLLVVVSSAILKKEILLRNRLFYLQLNKEHSMSNHFIKAIVSGGQTSADRAALDSAIDFKIHHGGWCPYGRKAEDGIISSKYNLREAPAPTPEENLDPDAI